MPTNSKKSFKTPKEYHLRGVHIPKLLIIPCLGPMPQPCTDGVKFGSEELSEVGQSIFGRLLHTEFHPHRCNVSPLSESLSIAASSQYGNRNTGACCR